MDLYVGEKCYVYVIKTYIILLRTIITGQRYLVDNNTYNYTEVSVTKCYLTQFPRIELKTNSRVDFRTIQ